MHTIGKKPFGKQTETTTGNKRKKILPKIFDFKQYFNKNQRWYKFFSYGMHKNYAYHTALINLQRFAPFFCFLCAAKRRILLVKICDFKSLFLFLIVSLLVKTEGFKSLLLFLSSLRETKGNQKLHRNKRRLLKSQILTSSMRLLAAHRKQKGLFPLALRADCFWLFPFGKEKGLSPMRS